MSLNPAPILLVHRGPAEVRAVIHDVVTERAVGASSPTAASAGTGSGRSASPTGSRPSPTHLAGCRALLADGHHRYAAYLQLQRAQPGTAADRGLAMLVDQDDTPLFLGAIHRTLTATSLGEVADAVDGVAHVRARRTRRRRWRRWGRARWC